LDQFLFWTCRNGEGVPGNLVTYFDAWKNITEYHKAWTAREILQNFWKQYYIARIVAIKIIGFNICGFLCLEDAEWRSVQDEAVDHQWDEEEHWKLDIRYNWRNVSKYLKNYDKRNLQIYKWKRCFQFGVKLFFAVVLNNRILSSPLNIKTIITKNFWFYH
jgi:hypothetical protein